MILRLKLRRGLRGRHVGRAARVVDDDIQAAVPGDDRVDKATHRVVVAHITGMELVRRPLDRASCAGHDRRPLLGENLADAGTDPSHAAGHQDDPAVQSQS